MQTQTENNGISDEVILAAIAFAISMVGVTFGGAWLAAHVQAPRRFDPDLAETVQAVFRLPRSAGDPRLAWPAAEQAALPGPVLYWTITGTLLLLTLSLVWMIAKRFGNRESLDQRHRLGVETQARIATKKDLRHLLLRKPDPNRFILGRFKRQYVSVEIERSTSKNGRSSGRGAISHIGPSQSGKTTNVTESVRHFGGPMILMSAKDDALKITLPEREQLGEIKTFDPTGVTGRGNCKWSPLRASATPQGALKAAKRLASTAPTTTGSTKADFWNTQAESLVTALMLVAANSDRTMGDVVRWILTRDMPIEAEQGEVAPLLRSLQANEDQKVRDAVSFARDLLQGIWRGDERTTSSIYATARSMVWAWSDPAIVAASSTTDIDLDWVLRGSNTLYVSSPLADHERVAPVLSGLLSDLIDQLFELNIQTGVPLNPPLLIVIDEAANLKLKDLPEWAATLSGLGVQLVTVWQSIAQIEAVYGAQSGPLLTNHPYKVIYPGMSDIKGLETISKLLGREHLPGRLGSSEVKPEQASATSVDFAPAAAIRQLKPGTALLISATLPPVILRLFGRR